MLPRLSHARKLIAFATTCPTIFFNLIYSDKLVVQAHRTCRGEHLPATLYAHVPWVSLAATTGPRGRFYTKS